MNMTPAPVQTPEQVAKTFGCTIEQARNQMRANAEQMDSMAEHAEAIGRKYRGYTAEYLRNRAKEFRAAIGIAEVAL